MNLINNFYLFFVVAGNLKKKYIVNKMPFLVFLVNNEVSFIVLCFFMIESMEDRIVANQKVQFVFLNSVVTLLMNKNYKLALILNTITSNC